MLLLLLIFFASDCNTFVLFRKNGRLAAAREPGLGVEPVFEVLGNPVIDIK